MEITTPQAQVAALAVGAQAGEVPSFRDATRPVAQEVAVPRPRHVRPRVPVGHVVGAGRAPAETPRPSPPFGALVRPPPCQFGESAATAVEGTIPSGTVSPLKGAPPFRTTIRRLTPGTDRRPGVVRPPTALLETRPETPVPVGVVPGLAWVVVVPGDSPPPFAGDAGLAGRPSPILGTPLAGGDETPFAIGDTRLRVPPDVAAKVARRPAVFPPRRATRQAVDRPTVPALGVLGPEMSDAVVFLLATCTTFSARCRTR